MVDSLLSASEEKIVTDFEIQKENVFLKEDVFMAYGMIENIAQSAALGLAYLNPGSERVLGEGFLAGISKLNVFGLPEIQDNISTSIVPQVYFDNMVMLSGEVEANGKLLLDCEIKLVSNE